MSTCSGKPGNAAPPTEMEQFAFWDGQTLRASDLNDFLRVEEARRDWHNRAVHNAYGISFGLEVLPDLMLGGGPSLTPTIRVSAGIAYDRFGRMLYQQFDIDIPFPSEVPSSVTASVLFLRWCEPNATSCCCSPPAKCCLDESVRRGAGVEFYWADAARMRGQEGVPIARVLFTAKTKGFSATLDKTFLVPRLRRFDRPHIAADATLPGATPWKLGPTDLVHPDGNNTSISWQPVDVNLDTSAAGFSQTPEYFAALSGPLFSQAEQIVSPVLYPHIADEFPDRFTFRFWIPIFINQFEEARTTTAEEVVSPAIGNVVGFDAFRNFARQQKLHVTWVGCEMANQAPQLERQGVKHKPCGCGTSAKPLAR